MKLNFIDNQLKITKLLIALAVFAFSPAVANAQQYTVCGYVKDLATGEVLVGATVYDAALQKGATTNGYGFYSLSLPAGSHTLHCSFVGYQTVEFSANLNGNVSHNFGLTEETVSLDAVTVTAEGRDMALRTNQFCEERLTMRSIRQMPSMFGEADVVKVVQLQSGVKTLGDGSSGMFVRGGGNDQNLILIDEAPIYNPSHLFGLVSIFNPDAVNHVELFKSNMPAQYGGRVSSVIDCKMKEGNPNKFDFAVGISPLSSTLTASGPVLRERASFLVSARKSLIDLFCNAGDVFSLMPAFYDVNAKLNFQINSRNRLFLSFYNGKDRIESSDGFFNRWGNTSGTLRWNVNIGSRLFVNTSVIVSDYTNYMEFNENKHKYRWETGITDVNLKTDLAFYISPENTVKAGLGTTHHHFVPGQTADSLQSIPQISAFEHFAYLLHDFTPVEWLGVNYGVRLSVFQNCGKATWYEYNSEHQVVGTKKNSGGVYKTHTSVEPRVNVNFKLATDRSLKLGYARNAQYMQVLQNSTLSYSSLETWFPANANIKPVLVDVVSAGWLQNLGSQYSLSVELYYKWYTNQIDYVDHARLLNNPYIEGEVRTGTARAYGLELNARKTQGRLTGGISYTYSRSLRTIDGINDGREYSSLYDIPHDLKINANYKLTANWSASAVWIYTSGRPTTLPVGFYQTEDSYTEMAVPIYSERNSSRFPAYHRLDLSVGYEPEKQGRVVWSANFGLYNVYGRKNPLGYRFDTDHGQVRVMQTTLFRLLPNFAVKARF